MHRNHRALDGLTYAKNMRVLVATDGSKASEAAVRFASSLLGGDSGSELVMLTVDIKDGSVKQPPSASPDNVSSIDGPTTRRIRATARSQDEVPEVICRQADRLRTDLIVVGSEGRETLEAWVVGGTALRLLYLSRRPVTVVRASGRRSPRRSSASR